MPFLDSSQGTTITGGSFIDASVTNYGADNSKGSGIKRLLESSLRQAIHNSSARDPPKCYPGTREEYIRNITDWGSGGWKTQQARALWMRGPAGVGKSAVAQTCAENIEESGRLGATFFFFRPNGWNDPDKFIPTIVYQLTTKYPAYRDVVDAIILRDPLVLETSLDVQFRELLVKPLHELSVKGQDVGMDAIIVVDGLDECKTEAAQGAIIELVTTSIHEQTTPFLWAFFSRPELHIAAAFSLELAEQVSWQLTLPVSRDADSDIEAYLRDGFGNIRKKYGLPRAMAWPSEEDIRRLVDQSSGLFVYATTIVRYIGQNTGTGHEAQLRSVLELGQKTGGSDSNPLSKLDQFYMLIMKQIPEAVLANTLSLLCLRLTLSHSILSICSALDLSLTAFHAATSNLYSVLDIVKSQGMPASFSFHHASFTDFLSDPKRSGTEFCVNAPTIRQRCLTATVNTLYRTSISDTNILAWSDSGVDVQHARAVTLQYLFHCAAHHGVHLGEDILRQLPQLNWSNCQSTSCYFPGKNITEFVAKIPSGWRSKIIRPRDKPLDGVRQILSNIKRGKLRSEYGMKTWIVGRGGNEAFLVPDGDGDYHLLPSSRRE